MEKTDQTHIRERRRRRTMASTPFKDSNGDTVRHCRRQHNSSFVQSLRKLLLTP